MATRPITDFEAYTAQLERFVFRSGLLHAAGVRRRQDPAGRVVYAEGEDERVLRARRSCSTRQLARPILVGRPP